MQEETGAREARHKTTLDLAFAGFAHMNELRLVSARQKGREFEFIFDDPPLDEYPNGRWDDLMMGFANSDCARYDASIRTLKKLCKRGGHTARRDYSSGGGHAHN